jgi:hypothetical protein
VVKRSDLREMIQKEVFQKELIQNRTYLWTCFVTVGMAFGGRGRVVVAASENVVAEKGGKKEVRRHYSEKRCQTSLLPF